MTGSNISADTDIGPWGGYPSTPYVPGATPQGAPPSDPVSAPVPSVTDSAPVASAPSASAPVEPSPWGKYGTQGTPISPPSAPGSSADSLMNVADSFFNGSGQALLNGVSAVGAPLTGGLNYLGTLLTTGDPEAAAAVDSATKSALTYHAHSTLGKQMSAVPAHIITSTLSQIRNPLAAKAVMGWMSKHFGPEFTQEVANVYRNYGPMGLNIDPSVVGGVNLLHAGAAALPKFYRWTQKEAGHLADTGHPFAATALGTAPKMLGTVAQYAPLALGAGSDISGLGDMFGRPPGDMEVNAVPPTALPPSAADAPQALPAGSPAEPSAPALPEDRPGPMPPDPPVRSLEPPTAPPAPAGPPVAPSAPAVAPSAPAAPQAAEAPPAVPGTSLVPVPPGAPAAHFPVTTEAQLAHIFTYQEPQLPKGMVASLVAQGLLRDPTRADLIQSPHLTPKGRETLLAAHPDPWSAFEPATVPAEVAQAKVAQATNQAPQAQLTPAQRLLAEWHSQTSENPLDPGTRRVNGNTSMDVVQDPFDPATAHVQSIEADEGGQGHGGAAMHQLATLADKHGVRLSLDPLGFGPEAKRMPPAMLEAFYKSHGFEPVDFNKEENENLSGSMARAPMGPQVNAPPLAGMPSLTNVNGQPVMHGPNPMARTAAHNYMRTAGLPFNPPRTFEPITPSRGYLTAKAFDDMQHNPDDPAVKASYDQLIKETKAQWKAVKRTGLRVQFMKPNMPDPYASNPRLALQDIKNNNHLWVYPTSAGYGNPMLNIGLNAGDHGSITPQDAVNAITALGPKIVHSEVHQSNTEPTLVASLNRALTPDEAHLLSTQLRQESIAQYAGGVGELHGPKAPAWRPFNPEYFLTHGGTPLSKVPPHPMLGDSGVTLDGTKLTNNDLFRIVHDYFGHAMEGNGFRADGEFNAYRIHKSMYSPLAQGALATETLGQNAWVNHGPHSEYNRTAKQGERVYADQKAGLLPPAVINAANVPAADWASLVNAQRIPGDYRDLDAPAAHQRATSRFPLPSAEGAVSTEVPPEQQAANKSLIHKTLPGLDEVRRAALTRNYSDTGNFFMTSKLKDPFGDRARGVIEAEQNAMRDAVAAIVPKVDTSVRGSEARGAAVQDAIDHAHGVLRDLDDKYYDEGNSRAAGKPAIVAPLTKFLTDNKSSFFKSPEGKQLWVGLNMRLQELGLAGNTDAFNPADAIQLDDLRKYLSGPASPNVGHLIGGAKDAIDQSMALSAGPHAYTKAYANRALRGRLFERNSAVKPFLPSPDGVEANRKVQASRVMDRLFSKSTSPQEFGSLLDTLRTTRSYLQSNVDEHTAASELDTKIRDAYQALREESGARLQRRGQNIERGWDQKSFAQELQDQEPKMEHIWGAQQLQRWEDLSRVGNLLKMDRSYPGAHASGFNPSAVRVHLANAAEGAITGGVTAAASMANPMLGAASGAAMDMTVAPKLRAFLQGNARKALQKFEAEHIVDLRDPPEGAPSKGGSASNDGPGGDGGGHVPIPGEDGKVSGFDTVRPPTVGDRLFGGKMRGGPKAVGGPKVTDYMTKEEIDSMQRGAAIKQLTRTFHALPPAHEYAAAALAGAAKRGWYRGAAHAVTRVFGPDAPRFSALMGALSPQTSVQMNFHNALRTFINWDKAGRPTSANAIKKIMESSVLRDPSVPEGHSAVLPAWFPNAVRALTSKDPEALQLSGPKVDSFMKNLHNNVNEVTNDTWMANFARMDTGLLGGLARKNTTDNLSKSIRHKGPHYIAMSAKVREAAAMLSHMTGEAWTPREVQETVWSWAKTAREHADTYGGMATIPELVKHGELTDELIRSAPGFAQLFDAPEHRDVIGSSRYGENARGLASEQGEGPISADTKQAREAAAKTLRPHLISAAERLEAGRTQGGEKATAARARLGAALQKHGMGGKLPSDDEDE